MNVKLEIDRASLRAFDASLRQYAAFRKLDNAAAINRQAGQVALRAMWNTRTADPAEIKRYVELSSVTVFGKSGKRLKNQKLNYRATDKGFLIFLKSLYQRKINPRSYTDRAALLDAARKFWVRRQAAVGFIRAGWIPAVKKLAKAINKTVTVSRRRSGKGGARVAIPATTSFAEIWNKSTSRAPGADVALVRHASEGLNKAFADVARDMKEYIVGQLALRSRQLNLR